MFNLNKDIVEGKWTEIKGDILKAWGHLTHNEIDESKGNLLNLQGLIQQKYGESKEEVAGKFNSIMSKYDPANATETKKS